MPAYADDKYVPKLIPPCTLIPIPGIGQVCGYEDIEEYKKLLLLDAELVAARAQLKESAKNIDALKDQHMLFFEQITLLEDTRNKCIERDHALTTKLIQLDLRYQKARARPNWGSPLAWGIAIATTAGLVGVIALSALE